ncbi:MAG: hypothetical protein FJ308_01345 [Planctomycetes bacterium]|nr:hypothetical protein [Planctomycetota bacterium]
MSLGMLLLMFLWVFPRPIVHSHEELASSNTGVSTLQEHLTEFHTQATPPDNKVHVHWVLNNGSILFATCNASSPAIVTSLSSPELANALMIEIAFKPVDIDFLATDGLHSLLAQRTSPIQKDHDSPVVLNATLQPSLISLNCMLVC